MPTSSEPKEAGDVSARAYKVSLLINLLRERGCQLRKVDRLLDCRQEARIKQAVALAAGEAVERIAGARQHAFQFFG